MRQYKKSSVKKEYRRSSLLKQYRESTFDETPKSVILYWNKTGSCRSMDEAIWTVVIQWNSTDNCHFMKRCRQSSFDFHLMKLYRQLPFNETQQTVIIWRNATNSRHSMGESRLALLCTILQTVVLVNRHRYEDCQDVWTGATQIVMFCPWLLMYRIHTTLFRCCFAFTWHSFVDVLHPHRSNCLCCIAWHPHNSQRLVLYLLHFLILFIHTTHF